ncbi:MAG: DNA-processing protein DprA [Patescibacteria group bacterium]|mgnify:FL=1
MAKDTQVLYKEDAKYPNLLVAISDSPEQLYYKGTWQDELFENCLAVVGSRHMTSYGKRATEQLVGEVARAGVTIVSGFMYGVDATAHKAALEAGGKTIAVMPCGIERIHPEHQKDLYQSILETGGLILSEWDGSAMPAFWTYPKRNRIVAGLCKATLIVEAGLKSGSLITAELAKKFGRKVFAVPGPITSEVSKGTAKLLQEGALLASSPNDILEYYDKKALFEKKPNFFHSKSGFEPIEQKVLEVLQRESLEADLLARTLGVSAAQLGTTLSLLELQGIIKQEGGKYYVN